MSDETTAETSDHDEVTEAPARPRVPNVRPGAVSGLDNVLLNPDEDAAAEQADSEPVPDEPDSDPAPDPQADAGADPTPDPGTGDDTTDAGPDAADPDPDAPGA